MTFIDEILQRLASLPDRNFWSALVVESDQHQQALAELEDSIPIFTDKPVKVLAITDDLASLIQAVQESEEGYVLLWQFEAWQPQQWHQFDFARSQFSRSPGGLLLLTPRSAGLFQTHAPNFASWVGSRLYDLQLGSEVLTEAEIQQRLEDLHELTGKTDAEVIQLAETGQLPPDPEYGEWLVLLNKGDWIERTSKMAGV
jgi:hypothetical protein